MPTLPFAVSAGAVATPLAAVTAVAVVWLPKRALAPFSGAVNVTVTPGTGLLSPSRTVACNAVANAVLIAVLCALPAVAVTVPDNTVNAAPLNVTLPDDAPLTIFQVTLNV